MNMPDDILGYGRSWPKPAAELLKSLAIPQLLYTSSVLHVPNAFIEKVDTNMTRFLWNNKPAKIKASTIVSEIEDGWLKMPKFKYMVECQK